MSCGSFPWPIGVPTNSNFDAMHDESEPILVILTCTFSVCPPVAALAFVTVYSTPSSSLLAAVFGNSSLPGLYVPPKTRPVFVGQPPPVMMSQTSISFSEFFSFSGSGSVASLVRAFPAARLSLECCLVLLLIQTCQRWVALLLLSSRLQQNVNGMPLVEYQPLLWMCSAL